MGAERGPRTRDTRALRFESQSTRIDASSSVAAVRPATWALFAGSRPWRSASARPPVSCTNRRRVDLSTGMGVISLAYPDRLLTISKITITSNEIRRKSITFVFFRSSDIQAFLPDAFAGDHEIHHCKWDGR